MILDLFAGVGWAVGLQSLGLHEVGIEIDRWACATRAAMGYATIRADVSTYPPEVFAGRVEGLIASPPCPDFSRAGKRAGLAGKTGRLVFKVMRWAEAIRPLWIACEQVPDVLPIWEEYAWRLHQLGYSTWTGCLLAADYGVPQTRERAFLLARRGRPALPPEPTHCRGGRPADLWGRESLPWVSMADALGWHRPTSEPAPAVTAGVKGSGPRLVLHTNRGQRLNGDRQTVAVDRPAPAITGKSGGQWEFGRPATTIAGSFARGRVAAPGHHGNSTYEQPEAVRVSVDEAAVLQGFPPGFPWQGTKTAKFSQIGNAVPPPWAAAIVGALTGREAGRD